MDNLLLRRRMIVPKEYSLSGAMPLSFNARRMPLKSFVREGKCEQRNLPSGYTQLEYIESTGDQWIDTGIVPSEDMKFELDVQEKSGGSILSAAPSSTNRHYPLYTGASNGKYYVAYFSGITQTTTQYSGTRCNIQVIYKPGEQSITVDGTSIYSGSATATAENISGFNKTLYLFGCNSYNSATTAYYMVSAVLYSCKIWQSDVLIADYVPAKNSSNVLGLYNKVNGAFLTNQGTGSFTAGPAVTPTPSPSSPVDIWCNNGKLALENVYDKNDSSAEFDGYMSNVGVGETTTFVAQAAGNKCIIVPVKPSTQYNITRNTNLGNVYNRLRVASFSQTTKPGSGSQGLMIVNLTSDTSTPSVTITTGSNAKWLGIYVRGNGTIGTDWDDFKKSFVVAQTTPYIVGTPEVITDANGNTAGAVNLLGVDDFKDTQDLISGIVSHRIGIKVLDGTENCAISSNMFKVFVSLPVEKEYGWNKRRLCTHGTCGGASGSNTSIEIDTGVIWFGGGITTAMGWTSASDGKAWLKSEYVAGHPVIIVYPIATETTEQVTAQALNSAAGSNTLSSTANVQSPQATVKYFK